MELTHNSNAYQSTSSFDELRVLLRRKPWLKRILALPLSIRRKIINREQDRFEKIYNEIFKNVIDADVVVAVEELGGEFRLDYRSDLLKRIMRTGRYEPGLVEIITRYADSQRDVIDVGANIGLFSVFFANYTANDRRVLAIEPTPNALRLLRGNLERNRCQDKVIIFEGVATDQKANCTIKVVPGMEEYTSTGSIAHPRACSLATQDIDVPGTTVDELVKEHALEPGFIKIDTEGSECNVLHGAHETLKIHRPVIFCEASNQLLQKQNLTSGQLVEQIESHGYSVYNADAPQRPIMHPFEGELIAIPTNNHH